MLISSRTIQGTQFKRTRVHAEGPIARASEQRLEACFIEFDYQLHIRAITFSSTFVVLEILALEQLVGTHHKLSEWYGSTEIE